MTLDELRGRATGERDGYRVFDGEFRQMAVTLEDAEFLYALVRVTKPQEVLELGSGRGVSGRFIAAALIENGDGHLTTVEPDPEFRPDAERMLANLPVTVAGWAETYDLEWDIVFVDSGWQHRKNDIETWLSNGYKGLVVVHDANRDSEMLAGHGGVFLPGTEGLWVGRTQ